MLIILPTKGLSGHPGAVHIAYFIGTETPQANLPGEPDVEGETLTMTFPKDQGGLGDIDIAKWSAAYTLAGEDVGMCPGDYGKQPFRGE